MKNQFKISIAAVLLGIAAVSCKHGGGCGEPPIPDDYRVYEFSNDSRHTLAIALPESDNPYHPYPFDSIVLTPEQSFSWAGSYNEQELKRLLDSRIYYDKRYKIDPNLFLPQRRLDDPNTYYLSTRHAFGWSMLTCMTYTFGVGDYEFARKNGTIHHVEK